MTDTSRVPSPESRVPHLAFVFPGQGSQAVGMLADLAAEFPEVRAAFDEASEGAGLDLWELSQRGPEEDLGRTENTQPALLAASVAVWRVWLAQGGALPAQMAGHSLGEYSALVCAGALPLRDAAGQLQQSRSTGDRGPRGGSGPRRAEACRARCAQGHQASGVGAFAYTADARSRAAARRADGDTTLANPVDTGAAERRRQGARRDRIHPRRAGAPALHAGAVDRHRAIDGEERRHPDFRVRPRQGADRLVQAHRQIDRRARAGHPGRIARRSCGGPGMTNALQDEIALVTGASRGIGAAIADELAARGAKVIGTATSESGAQAITQRLTAHGGEGRVLNVTDGAAVEALIEDIVKSHGGLTILVNNAGITRDQLLMRMKDEDWQAILDTNLTSVYRTSKAVMRTMMKARRGRIINIASVVGVTGNPGQTNYA